MCIEVVLMKIRIGYVCPICGETIDGWDWDDAAMCFNCGIDVTQFNLTSFSSGFTRRTVSTSRY